MNDDPATADADHSAIHQRCTECDVTWRGDLGSRCWFCGAYGVVASATQRIVPDEHAA